MNKKDLAANVAKKFMDISLNEARTLGYKGSTLELRETIQPELDRAAIRFVETKILYKNEFDEEYALKAMGSSLDDAVANLKTVIGWIAEDLNPTQVISESRIKKVVHVRVEKASRADSILNEGFFPFDKKYEV